MNKEPAVHPHRILPVGTQVVTRAEVAGRDGAIVCPRGAVGVVIQAPGEGSEAYRVRFPDGREAPLRREEMEIRKHREREGLERAAGAAGEIDLYQYVIYRCVVGSRAYGLDEEASDTDRRGIYLPPAEMHWSLYGVPEQLENSATQECYWELRKFLTLALKGNPNILECLYTPLVETVTPVAEDLLAIRSIFLSRLIYQTYNGYVMSQFKKLAQDRRNKGELNWKHAMHLIRLLLSGVSALTEGQIPIAVGQHREQLLAIRHGAVPWEEVDAWRLALHKEFDAAFAETRLPEYPDYEKANAFLLWARRRMVVE